MRLKFSFLPALALTALLAGAAGAQESLQVDRDTGLPIGPGGYRGALFVGGSPVARTTVSFDGKKYRPGSVVINTAERRLYYVIDEGRAVRYGIGVGRLGFTWTGMKTVSQKREWPDWTPPPQMLKRRPDLPRWMPGGPEQSARRARDLSRLDALPHPRLERAGDDRPGGVVRLLSYGQRGRHRSLWPGESRHRGARAVEVSHFRRTGSRERFFAASSSR